MCITCGCGQLNNDHGNPDSITMERLQKAAKAANESLEDAARNIAESVGISHK